ncbi:putative disease resistance RPP13-like protein 1 isoform X1 [Zingiber officinale]|uniref:putative disease resistance RPP13-like protein 1 isoform X1 n=2 Tax=Zingiber officinale TaxID=94328 RepID=UPI001C4A9D50|nr:putative disease resistance RPP13-like protein 1 isoform X1 [Zingiber officinale]
MQNKYHTPKFVSPFLFHIPIMAMVLDFFISKFITATTNMMETEIFKVLGVDKEIKALQERLGTINGYLRQAEQKRHGNDEIDIWMQKLKDLMYDADDIIDLCIIEGGMLLKARALSGSSTVSIPFSYLFSCFQCLKYRHDIANQIIALNSKIEDLKKDTVIKNNLDWATKVPVEYVNRVITHETSHLQVEGDIVGTQIETATETLINWIVKKNPKCRVFGVVGTGGIGKSTLARKIFEDERIKDYFPNRKWLYVSKNYIEIDLLKKLIRFDEGSETNGEILEGKSKAELENKLVSILTRNTFIVLDDVWNSSVWADCLRIPIMKGAASCTVLVTSRKEQVVTLMKATYIYPVEKMNDESGWNLLKHLAFEGEGDEDQISSFEEIGIKLVNKCDGLPLAIKAIAGVLYQQNKAKWEEVLQSDAWNMDQIKEELRPLYLSYEDLPSSLKQCFLYCSLYPQKDMYSKEIVQFWVTEGLIMDEQDKLRRDLPTEKQRTKEDIGEEIYRELLCRNLLEVDVDLDMSKSFFSMHDHFRSLGAHLMREEGILYRHGREFKVDDNIKIRRLSISCMGPKLVLPAQVLRQGCLRTLILTDSPKTKTIEDSVLRALPCLRVLDLTKTSIEKIPDCIGDLLHLRYLDLDGTNISEIPTSIGNLVNLQSLNISECEFLERLPVSITKLHNLRWLDMRDSPMLTHVPKGIGKLENFYNLEGFMVGQNGSASEEGCDLEELKNLSELRVLSIYRLERAEGGASALANMPFLMELVLGWKRPDEEEDAKADEEVEGDGKDDGDADKDMGDGDDDGSGAEDENEETEKEDENEEDSEEEDKGWSEEQISKAERICNEMTQPSSTIFDLLFSQYPGRQFPIWMQSSSLAESFPNLTYLKLIRLPCCTKLPPLGTLPQLKYLRIESATAITTIGSQFLGSRSSAFPKLEMLQFQDMPSWEEWTFNGTPLAVKLFPILRTCNIIDCPNLRALPEGLCRATNFNQLCLHETYELGEIDNLALAYRLEVTNGIELKKISNIPSLRYLAVDGCPSLECVENLGKLQHLALICSEETEQLPQWLLGLIEQHNNTASTQRSLRKFEMQCNLQLLKSCLEGNENWDIIKQIPNVKIQTYSSQEYMFYTKDPYNYDAKIPSN